MNCAPKNLFIFLARCIARDHGCRCVFEHRFHPHRRWRFDVAFPEKMIAAEIDGAVWVQGRHTRGKGFIGDQEKTNEAQLLGWQVYRFVPADLESGKFLDVLYRALSKAQT
jgi:hypothetical protein